ncbi:MAG TPA: hypothetical protein VFX64_02035 [Candidatus Nitrosotalea sp.]|nr:hypothetical protein [Candidatus Nitrosotalea sp.]
MLKQSSTKSIMPLSIQDTKITHDDSGFHDTPFGTITSRSEIR